MNRIVVVGIIVAALAAVPLAAQLSGSRGAEDPDTVWAQAAEEPGLDIPGVVQPDEALIRAQLRIQELDQELLEIQEQVLADNEELGARAQALDERLFERMEEVGYDGLAGDLQEIENVFDRLEAGELSQEEAQVELEARAETYERLQQAQHEALQDEAFAEELARDRRALAEDVVAAMHEKDERTGAIIAELESIERELAEALTEPQR